MKKLLFVALAAVGMTACVQNEELVVAGGKVAIAFENAYVYNATKADNVTTTTGSITGFDVWAYMDEVGGTVLTDEDVTKNGGTWGYTNIQYWMPKHTYYFAALSPMNSANVTETLAADPEAQLGLGTVAFTNVDGTEDLLYAKAKVETPEQSVLSTTGMDPVKLQFQHLLSKVRFTFKNGFTTDNMKVTVSNVEMSAPKSATIDLAVADYAEGWVLGTEKFNLQFGSVEELAAQASAGTAEDRLTIPAAATEEYTVTFDVVVKSGSVVAYEIENMTATIKGYQIKMGCAYNFIAEITPDNLELKPIEFTAQVDEWDYAHGGDEHQAAVGYYVAANGSYVVASEIGLQQIANGINAGEIPADTNIVLNGDVDLSLIPASRSIVSNWTPIGSSEKPFTGVFDGNGYTIKNLILVEEEAKEGKAHIGFISYAKDATIKDVTFENVYVNIPCLDIDHSQGHIGAVVGSLEGTSVVENVTVQGDVKIEATPTANGASRVAAVVGGNTYANVTLKNVHVIANAGSYVKANNNTGAIAGQLQGKTVYENCSSNIDVTVNKFFAGGIVGLAGTNDKFINCHTTGNIAVVAGREGRHNDEYRVGGIAGGWADGATKVCTLENCSYTGTVSGQNADGAVAEPLDYMGYVGRGYTLANCAGSKVIIDGTEFVQKYNDVYGVYTINGCTPVSTAEELVAALAAGEGVYLLNDITVAATNGGYNKAGILQNKVQTIDGAGHTLTVTGAGATWDCAIYTNGGTIKNLTVKGAMRGIFTAGQSADLYIENVEFKNVIYTFNSDGNMPVNPFGVYVSNSKVNGWTSHSNMHTEVVYTNCSFGEGSGYKYCRPYGKTSFVGCTFCAGYTLDKSQTTDITLTDCIFE